ncbi:MULTISPECIES: cation diffusion facilitator family transporter [Achromobacter]|jgi:cobalt-zinc-cadmium efflux system protein|uniref:Cadmium, cobalt and zinc/H(+)-K(+) antiporter n=1 Tax=Achromobacter aegrifaciens TaxID=1287736 RepID=A0AAD2J1I2_ACHAE|nr:MULTISPECIES: cation diffusion facilitator family transporter [Achromobacter]PTN50571.1 cation transporter [Achromobacter xylosoxidans]MBD9380925.1 cation transporter [Achromobacter sp. ACM02]MBD9419340.1 cation transporter [Achromobacter sp. ACM04]MBD9475977.1 cation transporter [Achromobacter sp. ACM01]MDQ1762627.1 cation diffusion facilitator family transporter [Achromobacter aegrifaciens]
MSDSHQHGDVRALPESRLWIALGLTGSFMLVEIAGGLITGSLALISDAMHMMTDAMALLLALVAIRAGRKAADLMRTYGYARFEILAAAVNALVLLGVAFYILYEAYQRLSAPQEIQSLGMLAVAVVGLIVNLISMRMLAGAKDESLNVKGAYLEVWADMLGSIGVIVGAVLIWFTGWRWVDSALAVGIGFMVFPRTWVLLRECVNILLEGVPPGMNLQAVRAAIAGTAGVASIHDIHLWAVTQSNPMLTGHVVLAAGADGEQVRRAIEDRLQADFDLHHTTLQMEREDRSSQEHIH